MQCSDDSRPWKEFNLNVPAEALAIYNAAVKTTVGDARVATFWEDRWIHGWRAKEVAPRIYDRIPARTRASRTVQDGLANGAWARDIGPDIGLGLLQEFFTLWNAVAQIEVDPSKRDLIRWAWEKDGVYSARSAYAAKFWGREVEPAAEFTWKSKAPLQCRFFTWLALQNRCWTSDRLARRGLPHQDACPLCDQHEESINHLLLECMFARQIWEKICASLGRPDWTPMINDRLIEWCSSMHDNVHGDKNIRAIVVLVMWAIWKHRNDVVFDEATPSIPRVSKVIEREGRCWRQAGLLKGDLDAFFGGVTRWVAGTS